MSGLDRNAAGGRPQDSEFAREVANFLNITNHPELRLGADEVWDCLWMVLPQDDGEGAHEARDPGPYIDPDAMLHELAGKALDMPELRQLQARLRSMRPTRPGLQEALVESLTDRYFPARKETQPGPESLAKRLFDTLFQHFLAAGEPADKARAHAASALRSLVRSPERHTHLIREAGLSELDEAEAITSSGFPQSDPTDPNEPPEASGLPPIIPEELYLESDAAQDGTDSSRNPAEGAHPHLPSGAQRTRTDALGQPVRPREGEEDPEEWLFRAFRFGDEEKWYGSLG